MDQHSTDLEGTYQAKLYKTWRETPREKDETQQHAHHYSCLVSDSTILLMYKHSAHDRMPQQK